DLGRVLTDHQALLAVVTLLGAADGAERRVAVPVVAPSQVDEVAGSHGLEVVHTKLASSALMEVAADGDVGLAATTDGAFAFPSFLPAFDAMATFVKVLELLARSGTSLSK